MVTFDLSMLADDGESPYAMKEEPTQLFNEFPLLIDNTAREQFFTCPQKFFRSTIQKLSPKRTSVHLHFGGAFAAGLEAMRKSFYDDSETEANSLALGVEIATRFYGDFTPPEGSHKTYANLIDALIFYVDSRPLAYDPMKPHLLATGKRAIEFTFAEPIPDCFHPVTNEPILYGGRSDMLADFQGCIFVLDDKTTSHLGPLWGVQWKLNSQFTGYTWAAKQRGLDVAGVIVRGQSILKNTFELAEIIVYRPQWMIDRWLIQLQKDVHRMIDQWNKTEYDYAIGGACGHFGGCEFLRLCTSSQPNDWIQSEYKNRHWNPLAKSPEEPEK